jgi:predicted NBD/HSP70 family sugar kinase
LKQRTQRFVSDHPTSYLAALAKHNEISLELLAQALEANDPNAMELVKPVVTYLSHAILIMVHLLDPAMVLLTGSMVKLGEPFLCQVREVVETWAFPYLPNGINIVAKEQDNRSILLGAGALVLEKELGL